MIQISGRGNEYVTGYHLMYSEDNVHWQPYKESHADSWKVCSFMPYLFVENLIGKSIAKFY